MTHAIWFPALNRVRAQLTAHAARPAAVHPDALSAIGDAVSDADRALAHALNGDRPGSRSHQDALLALASRVLAAASRIAAGNGAPPQPAAALESELQSLENAVLEGEATYRIDASQTRRPLDRAAHALMHLHDASRPSAGDRLALLTASSEIAALLVRVAANLATSGAPEHAAAEGSDTLSVSVHTLVLEAASALSPGRRAEATEDAVGRHLCECLRVPVDLASLDVLGERPRHATARRRALDAARASWLALAAREYAVASALDARLPALEYKRRHGSLANAASASAVNVLREARLLLRADAFRHRRAWGRQGIALSHAIQAYINGLHGNDDALERAQLIVLTRLSRSIAALALIEAQQQNLAVAGTLP
jgi:hypothetical protein